MNHLHFIYYEQHKKLAYSNTFLKSYKQYTKEHNSIYSICLIWIFIFVLMFKTILNEKYF